MIVECRNCGVEFEKKTAEVKRTKNHYCSKKCKGQYLSNENIKSFYGKCKRNGDCMEWSGALNNDGYGIVRYKGKTMLSHRVSYIIKNGEIREGASVCHKCDNPKCINPDHLFLGSHKENMEDMRRKGRKWSKLTFEDVAKIRSSDKSSSALAKEYSVSDRTIRYARDATHWMPLPEPPEVE